MLHKNTGQSKWVPVSTDWPETQSDSSLRRSLYETSVPVTPSLSQLFQHLNPHKSLRLPNTALPGRGRATHLHTCCKSNFILSLSAAAGRGQRFHTDSPQHSVFNCYSKWINMNLKKRWELLSSAHLCPFSTNTPRLHMAADVLYVIAYVFPVSTADRCY